MPIQPPLNPDALRAAAEAAATQGAYSYGDLAENVIRAYLAAAPPEATIFDPRELNRRGWTCGCMPGDYDQCDECQSACNELAGFLSRPEVKP